MQPMQPVQPGPGRKGVWIGVLLILLGVVGGIALIVIGAESATDTINRYQRVEVRRGGSVTFANAGRYNAYFERPGIRSRSQLPPIQVLLSGPGGEQTLDSDIARTNSTEHYDFGDHEGVRLTRFTITKPGRYEVRLATAGEPTVGPSGQIAFGKGSITSGLLSVVGGVLGGGLIAFTGVIVLITSAVRRSRYRRRMVQTGYGGYVDGYGAPSGWPPAEAGGPGTTWPPPTVPSAQPAQVGSPQQPPAWVPPPAAPPPPGPPSWPPPAPPGL